MHEVLQGADQEAVTSLLAKMGEYYRVIAYCLLFIVCSAQWATRVYYTGLAESESELELESTGISCLGRSRSWSWKRLSAVTPAWICGRCLVNGR